MWVVVQEKSHKDIPCVYGPFDSKEDAEWWISQRQSLTPYKLVACEVESPR